MMSALSHSRLFVPCIWLLTLGALAMLLGLTGSRALRSYHDASAAQVTLQSAARDASVVIAMRDAVPVSMPSNQSQGGLTPRVTAALALAGVPDSALASLSPEAESQVLSQPGLRITRRRATLTLSGITLPQVGRFLDAWRAAEPSWTTSGIDLSPASGQSTEAGGDQPLRAIITIETATVSHDGAQL